MIDPIQVAACAEELQKLAQGLDPQLLMALLGAGAGGYVGYKGTHDPRNKVRNAILTALAGGGLGFGLGHAMSPGLGERIEGIGKERQDIGSALTAKDKDLAALHSAFDRLPGGGVRLRAPTPPSPAGIFERMGIPVAGSENVAVPGMYGK